jgi:hypothetical protein
MNIETTEIPVEQPIEMATETTEQIEMPKTPAQHRKWCAKCADWKPFNKTESKYYCADCTEEFVETNLSDIPVEKVEEQQNRFRSQRREDFQQMMAVYRWMQENPNQKYPEEIKRNEIMEDDAGLLAIEDAERTKREAEHEAALADVAAHKHLGRNDKCPCSSGKKYKQCCLNRIKEYRM